MNIVILDSPQAIAGQAAEKVIRTVRGQRSRVLGLATGGTPVLLYAELVRRYRRGEVSFRETTTFNLDEYVGVPAHSHGSYRHYMKTNLFDHVDLPAGNCHLPDGAAQDVRLAANRYEQAIASSGGIDLQILGVGSNGHIGFNEPGSSFASRTRIVALAESTIDSNRQYFETGEEVPGMAITVGIGTILDARQLLLVAVGAHKAQAMRDALEGPISASCPGSALQLHPNVTVMLDHAAASLLANRDYYMQMQQALSGLPARRTDEAT